MENDADVLARLKHRRGLQMWRVPVEDMITSLTVESTTLCASLSLCSVSVEDRPGEGLMCLGGVESRVMRRACFRSFAESRTISGERALGNNAATTCIVTDCNVQKKSSQYASYEHIIRITHHDEANHRQHETDDSDRESPEVDLHVRRGDAQAELLTHDTTTRKEASAERK